MSNDNNNTINDNDMLKGTYKANSYIDTIRSNDFWHTIRNTNLSNMSNCFFNAFGFSSIGSIAIGAQVYRVTAKKQRGFDFGFLSFLGIFAFTYFSCRKQEVENKKKLRDAIRSFSEANNQHHQL